MQETLKKYGLWVAGAAVALYLVYRNMRGGARQSLIPAAVGASSGLEAERLRQAGAFDLERLRLESGLEAQRLKAANDRFNLEQQALARQRALDAAQRGQTLGLIGNIAKGIADLFKTQQQQRPGTPPTFPSGGGGSSRTQLPLPPSYPIPEPDIGVFNPPFTPEYPQISEFPLSVTDWGEAPQFANVGMDVDSGATFYDQWGGSDFYYGYGADYSSAESSYPDFSPQYVEDFAPFYDAPVYYGEFGGGGYYNSGGGGGYEPGVDYVDFGEYTV